MKVKTLTPKELSILEYKAARKYPRTILQALAQRIGQEEINDDNIDSYEKLLDMLMNHIAITEHDEENLRILTSEIDDKIDEYHFNVNYPVIKDEDDEDETEDNELQRILEEVKDIEINMIDLQHEASEKELNTFSRLRKVLGDALINMGNKLKS